MKANRIFRILKWTAGIIISLVVLVAVATLLANSNYVQQQLLKKATSYLSERLGTSVKADSVSVNLFVPSMSLYGLDIEDQHNVYLSIQYMFHLDYIFRNFHILNYILDHILFHKNHYYYNLKFDLCIHHY